MIFFKNASFPPARWLYLNSATRACLLPAATLRFRMLSLHCLHTASPTGDWGSLLVRRARALARGAAHPSGTGGAALAKPAPVPCWRRPAARQQPVCPTNGATSSRRPRGGELAELFATGRGVGAAPASPFQRPPTSEPRTTSSCGPPLQSSGYGPFAALGYPEHGPICFSGSRLRMPRAREG